MILTVEERTLKLSQNTTALAEQARLDGFYVLKTDLPATIASKERVHERYKDLEW